MDPVSVVDISYKIKEDSESYKTKVSVFQYTEKSIAITIDERFGKSFSNVLKENGGKFNPKLSIGKGWIFPTSKFGKIQDLFSKISSSEILGEPVPDYSKIPDSLNGILGNISAPPSLIVNFKSLLSKIITSTGEPIIYTEGNKIYIYGEIKAVSNFLKDYPDKPVFAELVTQTHSFVILI
jgi:hypothetical protein